MKTAGTLLFGVGFALMCGGYEVAGVTIANLGVGLWLVKK